MRERGVGVARPRTRQKPGTPVKAAPRPPATVPVVLASALSTLAPDKAVLAKAAQGSGTCARAWWTAAEITAARTVAAMRPSKGLSVRMRPRFPPIVPREPQPGNPFPGAGEKIAWAERAC